MEILFPKSKGLLVGIVYCPPDSSKYLPVDFHCKFESMSDLNCNYLVNANNKELKSVLVSFSLKQLVESPARITEESKTLIDIICSTNPLNLCSVKVIPVGLSDHELIGCIRK